LAYSSIVTIQQILLLFQTKGILKMTTREGEDINEPFIEKDWIRRNSTTLIPTFVIIICQIQDRRDTSDRHFRPTKKKTNLSVTDFLSYVFPPLAIELVLSDFEE
jgi:hypothetical protein